jgi:hypothetical protein
MDIFSLLKDNFNWLKKSIKYFNFWLLVIICLWLGLHIYSLTHQSELRRIDLFDKELSLKEERLSAQLAEIEKKELPLNFKQLRMLEYINAYQNKTNLTKVVITKEGFIFDDEKGQNTNINIIFEVLHLDQNKKEAQKEFENTLLSIPEKLLRMIPETRLGSPFVVAITEEGIVYLSKHKSNDK